MNRFVFLCVIASAISSADAAPILSFSSIPSSASQTGSVIQFNSADPGGGAVGSFTFIDSVPLISGPGYTFQVDTVAGGTDPLTTSLFGNITGTYNISPITTLGLLQTAAVTGSGTFSITDQLGDVFSGDVAWIDIYTVASTGGAVNSGASINLTNIAYSGTNTDLQTLAASTLGNIVTMSFSFTSGGSLVSLTSDSGQPKLTSTGFSGQLTVAPAPSALTMLLSVLPLLLGCVVFGRRFGLVPNLQSAGVGL